MTIWGSCPPYVASWIPETAVDHEGEYLINKRHVVPAEQLQLEAFGEAVRSNRVMPEMLREGFNAGVAVILGDEAMLNNEIITFNDSHRL